MKDFKSLTGLDSLHIPNPINSVSALTIKFAFAGPSITDDMTQLCSENGTITFLT